METIVKFSELTSSDKVSLLSRQIIDEIDGGMVNPLEAAVVIKALEEVTKKVRGHILYRDAVLTELAKYDSKTVQYNGATFQVKTVGTRYDFEACNDPVYNSLKARFDIAASRMKEREDFLKVVPPGGMTVVDEGTGEVSTIYPPAKKCEDGYSITLK